MPAALSEPKSTRGPASLADALRALDDAGVERLLARRPDLLPPVPPDRAPLAPRAVTGTSVNRALDRLDAWTLAVAEALAVLPEPITQLALLDALPGAAPDDVEQAVTELRDRALVWGPDEDMRLVRPASESFGPTPAGLGPAFPARPSVALWVAEPERLDALLAEAPTAARQALELLTWGPPNG